MRIGDKVRDNFLLVKISGYIGIKLFDIQLTWECLGHSSDLDRESAPQGSLFQRQ